MALYWASDQGFDFLGVVRRTKAEMPDRSAILTIAALWTPVTIGISLPSNDVSNNTRHGINMLRCAMMFLRSGQKIEKRQHEDDEESSDSGKSTSVQPVAENKLAA